MNSHSILLGIDGRDYGNPPSWELLDKPDGSFSVEIKQLEIPMFKSGVALTLTGIVSWILANFTFYEAIINSQGISSFAREHYTFVTFFCSGLISFIGLFFLFFPWLLHKSEIAKGTVLLICSSQGNVILPRQQVSFSPNENLTIQLIQDFDQDYYDLDEDKKQIARRITSPNRNYAVSIWPADSDFVELNLVNDQMHYPVTGEIGATFTTEIAQLLAKKTGWPIEILFGTELNDDAIPLLKGMDHSIQSRSSEE